MSELAKTLIIGSLCMVCMLGDGTLRACPPIESNVGTQFISLRPQSFSKYQVGLRGVGPFRHFPIGVPLGPPDSVIDTVFSARSTQERFVGTLIAFIKLVNGHFWHTSVIPSPLMDEFSPNALKVCHKNLNSLATLLEEHWLDHAVPTKELIQGMKVLQQNWEAAVAEMNKPMALLLESGRDLAILAIVTDLILSRGGAQRELLRTLSEDFESALTFNEVFSRNAGISVPGNIAHYKDEALLKRFVETNASRLVRQLLQTATLFLNPDEFPNGAMKLFGEWHFDFERVLNN